MKLSRKQKIQSVISGLILFFPLFSMNVYADPALPTPVGRVVWIKGDLLSVMPSKEERKLQKLSLIYNHDTLITNANSQAQLVFTDNSLLTLEKDSVFAVTDYQLKSKDKASAGKYVMNLIKGGFRTITGLIAKKNNAHYQVNTPVATIGVRGTDFAVHFDKGELYMNHYSGKPCVKSTKGELCLDEHHRYAKVATDRSLVALKEQPIYFKEKLEILPAVIADFTPPAGSSGVKGNSFCISQ